jgi:ketosteroid isomerase-like protein
MPNVRWSRHSAKAVARRIMAHSNQLNFSAAFDDYSADADTRYVENGVLFPSLDSLKKSYAEFVPILELVNNSVDAWDVTVLGPDAAVVTLPIHLKIKAKDRPQAMGQYVWSAVIQRRGGRWKAIQTHESWQQPEKLLAALVPPPTTSK